MISRQQYTEALDPTRRRPRVRTAPMLDQDGELVDMTVQSDRTQSELKHILAKYEATGVLVNLRDVDLEYRDVSEFEDYVDMSRQLTAAKQAFMRLPPQVREVFDHSVEQWLDAAHDREKFDRYRPQLEELGVVERVEAPRPPGGPAEPVSAEVAE